MANKDRIKYNAYTRVYMLSRYKRRMADTINFLGGKCVRCGTTEDLEFDHVDRTSKTWTIAKIYSYSDSKFFAELKKCQLLCKKCHNIKSITDLGKAVAKGNHGTISTYKYCKCEICVKAKADYTRAHSKSPKKPHASELRHGSKVVYSHHKCRCNICRMANSQRARDYRNKKKSTINLECEECREC